MTALAADTSRRLVRRLSPAAHRGLARARRHMTRFVLWRQAGLLLAIEIRARFNLWRARRFKPMPRRADILVEDVIARYLGTTPDEGIAQLAILMHEGCRPRHKVLEIGCGALHAGYPIMQYLEQGNYCGIDPNEWLIESSLHIPEVSRTAAEKRARFDHNEEFDGSRFETTFDFIISHSVLSHAAHWQWPLFLQNVSRCARNGSKVLASLHFTDGNGYGGPTHDGSELDFNVWQYPGISAFRRETVFQMAADAGFSVRVDLASGMLITEANGSAVHSWIVLEKTGAATVPSPPASGAR